jgi:hypothetical protein
MIRKLIFVVMAVGLVACTPEAAITSYHWSEFLKAPDEAHFKSLHADIKACNAAGCQQSKFITEEMINALADLVKSKNYRAMHLGLASPKLLIGKKGAERLAASYGPVIYANPQGFLEAAKAENNSEIANVLTTPQGQIANYNGEYNELGMRRTRISQVDDPALVNIRDKFVTAIDARRKAIEPGLVRVPTPPQIEVPLPLYDTPETKNTR